MGTIYVIGAGFSKTCGVATDIEMLEAINPRLKPTEPKGGGQPKTSIQYLLEQNFRTQKKVGFELFMSTLSALKFLPDSQQATKNVFREMEREIKKCLTGYLKSSISKINWRANGKIILDFAAQVNWSTDFFLTFNYDLLLESAATKLGVQNFSDRIIHLHGSVAERTLAWPIYTKFAYQTTKKPLSQRWNKAFDALRNQPEIDRLVFIGYSMPASDLEAKGLFNYADMYNSFQGPTFYHSQRVPDSKVYSYEILVITPEADQNKIRDNYSFFRKTPIFIPKTLAQWMDRDKERDKGGRVI